MKISENRARSLAGKLVAQAAATHGTRWESMTGTARTDAIKSKILDFLLNQLHEEFEPAQELVLQILSIARPKEDEAVDNLAVGPDDQSKQMDEMMAMMKSLIEVVSGRNTGSESPPVLSEVIERGEVEVKADTEMLNRHNYGVQGGSTFGRVAQPMAIDDDIDEAKVLTEFEEFNKR